MKLYKKHFDCDVYMEDINKNYATPLDDGVYQEDIDKSIGELFITKNIISMVNLDGYKVLGLDLLDAKGFVAIAILENHICVQ